MLAVVAAACASLSCGALYRYKVRDLAHDHPDVVYFVDTRAKAVALTLDDGPDATTTPAILDLLGQNGARATFFLITSRVPGNEGASAADARRGARDRQPHGARRAEHRVAGPGVRAAARRVARASVGLRANALVPPGLGPLRRAHAEGP